MSDLESLLGVWSESSVASATWLSHVVSLHMSVQLKPFCMHWHFAGIKLEHVQDKNSKTAFGAGLPFIQSTNDNPF